MGGTKKKSIGAMEKAQQRDAAAEAQAKKKAQPSTTPSLKVEAKADEKQIQSALSSLKAVTLYAFAKALGMKASAANLLLRSLEANGVLRRVGGYSGHYVYAPVEGGRGR